MTVETRSVLITRVDVGHQPLWTRAIGGLVPRKADALRAKDPVCPNITNILTFGCRLSDSRPVNGRPGKIGDAERGHPNATVACTAPDLECLYTDSGRGP